MKIMLNKGIPKHEQITNWIRQRIQSGQFNGDDKLPSESELSEKFNVSRVTVRRALQTLENEQLIYRCQGVGSFVSDERPSQSFVRLTDFIEDMKRAGMEASSSIIQFRPEQAAEPITSILNIKKGSTIIRLDRLRKGNGEPIAFDITWLPLFYGQLIDGHDLEADTIYRILEREYDVPVEQGCYRIEAEKADPYLAEHLEVNPGEALLLIDRLSYTIGNKPVYYQKRYYRTDRIVYQMTAERQSGNKDGSTDLPLREFQPVFTTDNQ